MKTLKKSFDRKEYNAALKIPDQIRGTLQESRADALEFGQSWHHIRGANYSSTVYALDKKYNAKFMAKRSNLMGRAKGVVTKINMIEKIAAEADAFVSEARLDFAKQITSGPQDQAVIEEEIKDLVKFGKEQVLTSNKNITELENFLKKEPKAVTNRMKIVETNPEACDEVFLNVLKSKIKDLIAMNKEVKAAGRVLKKKLDVFNKSVASPSAVVQKQIAVVTSLEKRYKQAATDAADAVKGYANVVNAVQKLIDKAGKKK